MTRNSATIMWHSKTSATITLYETPIVFFDEKKIVLQSGGFKTATTKRRMNEVAEEFNLAYRVCSHKGEWVVIVDGEMVDFEDGMEIKR